MKNDVTPTLTLAKLYESQDQYLDAFLVYQKLNQDKATQETEDKMKELQGKIFSTVKTDYNEIIAKVFSSEERRKFGIIPHEDYLEMTRIEDEQIDFGEDMELPDSSDVKLFKNNKQPDIDLSDFSLENNPSTPELNIEPRDMETESVDVPVQARGDYNIGTDFAANADESSEQKEEINNLENMGLKSEEESLLDLNEILNEIKSVDLQLFSKFLQELNGEEKDLTNYKLSQLSEALKKFKNES